MANLSPEERELALVEKLDFRIANVSSNETKLQALLSTFLAPLLLKARSEHAAVINKVAAVIHRLSIFIKAPGIVLPVAALLDQFKTYPDSTLLRRYDLYFIQHSLDRLPLADRRQLVPKVLKGIGSDHGQGVDVLFNIFLRLLPDVKLPPRASKEDAGFREEIGLQDPQDAAFIARWLCKLFLLAGTLEQSTRRGLTEADFNFLTLSKPNETWTKEKQGLSLGQTSRKAVKFLESGAFTDNERYLPALYASAHADHEVSTAGNDMLKRTSVSLEDSSTVEQLFKAHTDLGPSYWVRILRLLSRSELATTYGRQIEEVFTIHFESWVKANQPESTGLTKARVVENSTALFEFLNWTARFASKGSEFSGHATKMIYRLTEFFKDIQGWPTLDSTKQTIDDKSLRCRAYETIGVLAKVSDMAVEEQDKILTWLLESLAQDPLADAVVHIDGALSSLTSVFRPSCDSMAYPHHYKESIRRLTDIMTKGTSEDDVRSARHAVVKIANHCYPFAEVDARWIDILAVSRRDERNDVVEEGHKGLDPWTYSWADDRLEELPNWEVMAKTHFKRIPKGPDTAMVLPTLVHFVTQILFLTALPNFRMTPGWQQRLEVLVRSDKATRDTVRQYLQAEEHEEYVLLILQGVLPGVAQGDDVVAIEQCIRGFLELASLAPVKAMCATADAVELSAWPDVVKSSSRQIQVLAAKAYGILVAAPTRSGLRPPATVDFMTSVVKDLQTATAFELVQAEGHFLALSYMISRQVYYGEEGETTTARNAQIAGCIPTISETKASSQAIVTEGLIQLWTAGIPAFGQPQLGGPSDNVGLRAHIMKQFVEPLGVQAKNGNEKAIMALGRIAMVTEDDEIVESIIAKLYELYEIKQAEVHFAVGEAIAAAVGCWDSEAVQLTLDVESTGTSYQKPHRPAKLCQVLEKLLMDSKNTKPSLIKASGIWLFCMIQYCSHLPAVQSRLREGQVAFMRLLSARDELVQETASRGLALVYEKGDPSLKDALTRDIVSSFTGSGPQIKVDEETELFEAGALPTGEGKSITSYKDIVSLANEVGDQTLVYKFMSLANNAATWATRSAFGRFGLSNILSESDVDPKLYPKLYRYRFDPNPNVQKSMDDIWKALVKDSNAVLETHFDAIMRDLLKSILGREWRVREASCAAISDLIQGRPFEKYEPYYQDIWVAALKVLDDVKGTVRKAALGLCIALSNTLVRQVEEAGSSKSTVAMMQEALPFLLSDKGIESTTQDVKLFAVFTIIKLTKSGGKALKPYSTSIVVNLLGLLSTIEPEQLNYYYNFTGEGNREKIDKMRSQMVSSSPLYGAIENLLPNMDVDVMKELAPQLEEVVRSAIGMPTKIGCGRVLGTLATRHRETFQPFAARFLQVMEKQILDRNDEVSSGYARAAAYIIRAAPDEAQTRFVDQIINLYLKSEDDTRRQKVADVVLALANISPDHFTALEGTLLPFAFVGKHDTDDYVHKEFAEVWNKHAGSSLTVARYIPEIVALIERALDTAQWALKHGGALASASLVSAVTGANTVTGHVNPDNLKAVWPVFEKSLALKTFASKEKLLDALAAFVKNGKVLWEKDPGLADKLRKIAVREAKRNNEAYRPYAFGCLWKVAAAREDLDMLDEISGVAGPHIADFLEDVEMKDSSDRAGQAAAARGEDMRSKTTWAAIEAIVKGYNRPNLRKDSFAELGRIVTAFEKHNPAPTADPKTSILAHAQLEPIRRTYWYTCVSEVFEEAAEGVRDSSSSGDGTATLLWFLATLDLENTQAGTEQQRLARAKAAKCLLQLWRKGGGVPSFADVVKEKIQRALEEERTLEGKKRWKSCLAIVSGEGTPDVEV